MTRRLANKLPNRLGIAFISSSVIGTMNFFSPSSLAGPTLENVLSTPFTKPDWTRELYDRFGGDDRYGNLAITMSRGRSTQGPSTDEIT